MVVDPIPHLGCPTATSSGDSTCKAESGLGDEAPVSAAKIIGEPPGFLQCFLMFWMPVIKTSTQKIWFFYGLFDTLNGSLILCIHNYTYTSVCVCVSLSWDVLWYLTGRNLCFNRRHWLIDILGLVILRDLVQIHGVFPFSNFLVSTSRHGHASWHDGFSDGDSPIKNGDIWGDTKHFHPMHYKKKMWFCQPKIGLWYYIILYIDEVCVSSLQSHIMATPFDIPMLAPDASMALSIGGGAGSWRANSSPKAPGKT